MNIESSGTLNSGANIQCFCTLVRGEELRQFYTFSDEVGSATPENLTSIILGFGTYLFPVNTLSNKKCTMIHSMRKSHGLKVRRYAALLIGFNWYLAVFPGAKISDKFCMTEINKFC